MATKKVESSSFLDDINSELIGAADGDLNIIEFVETITDAFDMKLFLSQRVILKAIYGLPFDDEVVDEATGHTEWSLMQEWVRLKKCNWRPNIEILAEVNALNALWNAENPGKPPRKHRDFFDFQEIIMQCGMRSSKSSLVGLIIVYEFYKLYKHPTPQRHLGIPSSSWIYITVLASTERQTKGTIFAYVKSYIENSTYFKHQIDQKEIIVRDTDIVAVNKNINIAAGHSRADSLVGRTAILVGFDEIAMFSNDDGKTSNAGDVYSRVGRATATFGFRSKKIPLSSVKEEGDFMQELITTRWDKHTQGVLAFDLTTFDVNPIITMETPVVAADYDRDPIAAARDYENIRPGASSGFLIPRVVDAATEDMKEDGSIVKRDPFANVAYQAKVITRDRRDGEVKVDTFDDDLSATRMSSGLDLALIQQIKAGVQSTGHCDPGIEKDSFGFACGHPEPSALGVATVIDIVLEWMPGILGKGQKVPVDVNDVEEGLAKVAQARNMSKLTFDHWESASSIQRLFRKGIPTFKAHFGSGLQFKIYNCLRERMNQGLVKIPNHPVLVEELKNLLLLNGSRVDHPKNKDSVIPGRGKISKDLADCVAMVNWHIATTYDRNYIREGESGVKADPNMAFAITPTFQVVSREQAASRIQWHHR